MQKINVRGEKSTFADIAYEHILKAIVAHDVKPGESLPPDQLASAMGLSQTPIKLALARLAGEGLVEFKTGHGPFVSAPTVDEVLELYDCRLMYEAHAIREGIERVDDAFLNSMQQAIRQHELLFSESDGTYESRRKVLEADKDFHLLILSLWLNQKASANYRQMNVHIRSFQLAYIPDYRRETSIGEHHEIYAGLEKSDAEMAVASVRHHIVASKEGFLKRVRMAGLV